MKNFIYVSFFTHFESSPIRGRPDIVQYFWHYPGHGPAPHSQVAKDLVNLYEKYDINGEYCTTPMCLLQLAEDFPETISKIKKLKLPVTRYPSAVGHNTPPPAGRENEMPWVIRGVDLSLEERLIFYWNYETHLLVPNWHLQNGEVHLGSNPLAGQPLIIEMLPKYKLPQRDEWLYGGTLAIQKILEVTPLPAFTGVFDGKEITSRFIPSPVQKALGVSSFEISYNPNPGPFSTVVVPQCVTIPMRNFTGEDRIEGLKWIAENMPREKPIYLSIAVGQMFDTMEAIENLFIFLKEHPEDYKIVWQDPEEYQWKPENHPLRFYQKNYGVKSFKEVLEMKPPIEKIKKIIEEEVKTRGPLAAVWSRASRSDLIKQAEVARKYIEARRMEPIDDWEKTLVSGFLSERVACELPLHLQSAKRTVTKEKIAEAAEFLLTRWSAAGHHGGGGFGGPPDYVEVGRENWSLCDAFQAFVYFLDHYNKWREEPENVTIEEILGPIDYPMYELKAEPKAAPSKYTEEYFPAALEEEYMPDPEVVQSQGLSSGTFWADDGTLFHAVYKVAAFIRRKGHVPGQIRIVVSPTPQKERGQRREVTVNPSEFLYGVAQLVRAIVKKGRPATVLLASIKIIEDERAEFIRALTPGWVSNQRYAGKSFIWRSEVPLWRINAAWTYRGVQEDTANRT